MHVCMSLCNRHVGIVSSFARALAFEGLLFSIVYAVDSSSGGACAVDDMTSLVQVKSALYRHGANLTKGERRRRRKLLVDACEYDIEVATSLIMPVIGAAAQYASWAGDPAFMAADMCQRRGKNAACRSKGFDDCSNGCEWNMQKQLCETLAVEPYISYAKAHPQSAFGLYTTEMRVCNGQGGIKCQGDCQWHPKEMKCKMAHGAFHRVMCSPAWQNLMSEVKRCHSTSSSSRGACSNLGCTVDKNTPECQKWFKMVFGNREGPSLLEKVSRVRKQSCENGEHSAKCEAVVAGAAKCSKKGKAGHCPEVALRASCQQDPTECRISTTEFDSICTRTDLGSAPHLTTIRDVQQAVQRPYEGIHKTEADQTTYGKPKQEPPLTVVIVEEPKSNTWHDRRWPPLTVGNGHRGADPWSWTQDLALP